MEYIPLLLKLSSLALALCIVLMLADAVRRHRRAHIIICLAALTLPFLLYPAATAPEDVPLNEQPAYIQEQMDVAGWYNDYKKQLDRLNNNWYQYNKIMTAFANNEISVQTVHVRLTKLYMSSSELHSQLPLMHIPEKLSDENHNLVLSIIDKTTAYAAAQKKIFEQSVYATDEANIQLSPRHEDQVYNLQKIMIVENPLTLDVVEDIAVLRDNLR